MFPKSLKLGLFLATLGGGFFGAVTLQSLRESRNLRRLHAAAMDNRAEEERVPYDEWVESKRMKEELDRKLRSLHAATMANRAEEERVPYEYDEWVEAKRSEYEAEAARKVLPEVAKKILTTTEI